MKSFKSQKGLPFSKSFTHIPSAAISPTVNSIKFITPSHLQSRSHIQTLFPSPPPFFKNSLSVPTEDQLSSISNRLSSQPYYLLRNPNSAIQNARHSHLHHSAPRRLLPRCRPVNHQPRRRSYLRLRRRSNNSHSSFWQTFSQRIRRHRGLFEQYRAQCNTEAEFQWRKLRTWAFRIECSEERS